MMRSPVTGPTINPAQMNEQGGGIHRGGGAHGSLPALPDPVGPAIASVSAPAPAQGSHGGGPSSHLNPEQFKNLLPGGEGLPGGAGGGGGAAGGAAAGGAEAAGGGEMADLALLALA